MGKSARRPLTNYESAVIIHLWAGVPGVAVAIPSISEFSKSEEVTLLLFLISGAKSATVSSYSLLDYCLLGRSTA